MSPGEVLVGVTGGIAAFKTAQLVSTLVQEGTGVTVIMTAAAERFIGAATFAALTGRPVARDLFDDSLFPLGAHIQLAGRADVLCVAPATANFLAKMALGIADDLLSTTYLCFSGTTLVAPAMNEQMWKQPAVQRHVTQLRQDGVQFVDPEAGWLSCRQVGQGRMAEPTAICAQIRAILAARKS